jgi:iron-only hydrogenase group A
MQFPININNNQVQVNEGETLLGALRRNGFKIPTLCDMQGFTPSGACRLCVVEVEGKRDLVTSCSYPVEPEMVVKTNSVRVIKARKALVEMLLSNHPDDCLYCERNGNCELQWLAEEMNIKERKFYGEKNAHKRDHSSPSVFRDPAKCILCNRCVRVCEEVQLVTAIEFVSRGNKTTVNSAFNKGLNVSSCINCGQCIMVCPTGALVDISHIERTISNITNPAQYPIALISSPFVASVAEFFNIKPGDDPLGLIVSALRMIGFKEVFDMGWASDVNIFLESQLLLKRLENVNMFPLMSSCCPAWIKYVEEFHSELIKDISFVKSPQQLMGTIVKSHFASQKNINEENVYTVSFMACVANKFEAAREETTQKGISEIDAVITVREFLRMLRSHGIDITGLTSEKPANPFNESSASGFLAGFSGGKAEAVAAHLHHMLKGKDTTPLKFSVPKNPGSKKEVKSKIGKYEVGFAWVSGIAEAQKYLDDLRAENRSDIHYLEVMACTGGCCNGGGQPIHRNPEKPKLRKKLSQETEKVKKIKVPGQNKTMEEFIAEFIKNNEENLARLYTRFHEREVLK